MNEPIPRCGSRLDGNLITRDMNITTTLFYISAMIYIFLDVIFTDFTWGICDGMDFSFFDIIVFL